MNLDFNRRYTIAEGFERLEKDNKTLLVNFDTTVWLRTNETGRMVLNGCDGVKSLYDIISKMAEDDEYDVDYLTELVTPFLEQCVEMGILQDSENCIYNETEIQTKSEYKYPNDIWIHVSDRCNLACPFCYSNSNANANISNSIDIQKTLNFLNGIPYNMRKGIIISGGEPFLFDDLGILVKELKSMGFTNILVITNGTVGSEKYADVFPYIDSLQISVDGTVPEIHDVTRGKGSFEKLCKNLEMARKQENIRILCSFTPNKHNISDLPNLPAFAVSHGIELIHVTRLIPAGRGKQNLQDLLPDIEKYNEAFRKFAEEVQRINSLIYYSREVEDVFKDEKEKQKYLKVSLAANQSSKVIYGGRRISCGLGSLISIGYDSKIYPCPSLSVPEYVVGDLSNSIDEVMSKVNNMVYEYSVDKCNSECANCKLRYFCGGGCRACSYGLGDIHMLDPNCSFYKEDIMHVLWNYDSPQKNDSVN